MHEIAVDIFEKLQSFQTNLNIRWMFRESNIRADMLCKCFDSDDSGIKQNVLSILTNQGGRIHVIDSPLTTIQRVQILLLDGGVPIPAG